MKALALLLLVALVAVAGGDSLRYHGGGVAVSLHGDNLTADYGPGCGFPGASMQNATGGGVLAGVSFVVAGGDVSIKFVNVSLDNTTAYNTTIDIRGAELIDIRTRSTMADIQTFCLGNFDLLLTTSAGRWSE